MTATITCPAWCSHHPFEDDPAECVVHQRTITVGEGKEAVSVLLEYAPTDRTIDPPGAYVTPEQYEWVNGEALTNYIAALQQAKGLIDASGLTAR